jgi:DNA-3-methyladenine glycosylase I
VTSESGIYERLCLEGFQSGLSWYTILRKREAFREAFAGFDPDAVSRFGARDVKRLLGNAGIVRHRGKIEAAIANARATIALRGTDTPLVRLFWSQVDSESSGAALSKELRRAGFRFVGPTTAYAAMQACGVVNDHIPECWVREAVEAERQSVLSDPLW